MKKIYYKIYLILILSKLIFYSNFYSKVILSIFFKMSFNLDLKIPVKCIIYYSEKDELLNPDLKHLYKLHDLRNKWCYIHKMFFDIDNENVIARFEGKTLFDILEKIYNVIYINDFYKYIPNLKINLYINSIVISVDNINIKEEILRFKQKYDNISMINYGVDSLYYILQSLNKFYMNA